MNFAEKHDSNGVAVTALINELMQLNIDLKVPSLSGVWVNKKITFSCLDKTGGSSYRSGSLEITPRVASKRRNHSLYKKIWQ